MPSKLSGGNTREEHSQQFASIEESRTEALTYFAPEVLQGG